VTHADASGVESRIERLHLEAAEGEYHLDFERSDSGCTRIEQEVDDEGTSPQSSPRRLSSPSVTR
jgi:hypothetical protein